jgi:hypothetical protein
MTLITLPAVWASERRFSQRMPQHAFQVRFGYFFPEGGGTLWDDVGNRFTLGPEEFNGPTWGLSFVTAVNANFEIGIHGDWYDRTVRSEERAFLDELGYPIEHDTTFSERPFAVDLRLVPGGRYRSAGRGGSSLKPVFYLGAGVGINLWEYEETGEFVDATDPTLPIYYGSFKESGEALEARVLAGLELPVSPGFNVLVEGRYSWSQDDLSRDLVDLGEIELGGAWGFVGASFRF